MTRVATHIDIHFLAKDNWSWPPPAHSGPDVNQKFTGEDDLIWCDRCQCNHRCTAGWEIEKERMIQKMARKLADRIDGDACAFT